MRRVFKGIAVVAVVVSLAVPAHARSREDEPGKRPSIIQILKQWIVRGLGDGLTVPRP